MKNLAITLYFSCALFCSMSLSTETALTLYRNGDVVGPWEAPANKFIGGGSYIRGTVTGILCSDNPALMGLRFALTCDHVLPVSRVDGLSYVAGQSPPNEKISQRYNPTKIQTRPNHSIGRYDWSISLVDPTILQPYDGVRWQNQHDGLQMHQRLGDDPSDKQESITCDQEHPFYNQWVRYRTGIPLAKQKINVGDILDKVGVWSARKMVVVAKDAAMAALRDTVTPPTLDIQLRQWETNRANALKAEPKEYLHLYPLDYHPQKVSSTKAMVPSLNIRDISLLMDVLLVATSSGESGAVLFKDSEPVGMHAGKARVCTAGNDSCISNEIQRSVQAQEPGSWLPLSVTQPLFELLLDMNQDLNVQRMLQKVGGTGKPQLRFCTPDDTMNPADIVPVYQKKAQLILK